MRNESRGTSGDALQHERVLIAAARERAAQARTRAAAAWTPPRAGPLWPGLPVGFTGDPMEPLHDLLPGYQIEREIHRGGQGVVYQALQRSTRRRVAINVMKEGPFAGADDKARFDREVRILGQLEHPSIVAIHDSGTAAGCFYFVMNYIAGLPLDAYMRGGERTLEETLRLFIKICDAVNAAHLRGVIHRDLKPSNIRIDADGQPHVLDFGLAKVEEGSAAPGATIIPAMTLTGQFVGSLPWASPEQAAGVAGGPDVRSDVYSLGVVLYQMLTGAFPYDVSGNMHDVVQRILHAEPIRPSAAVAQSSRVRRLFGGAPSESRHYRINDEVETIVLKCLSKERQRRYQNAGELARDIGHYLAGEPIEARRASLGYVLRKHVRHHRLGFGFACTLLLVLVAGLIVSLTFWRQAAAAQTGLESALERADQREKDIRQVADAQAKMLSDVDPETMGARLREDVLAEARAALGRSGASAEEQAASIDQLESLLAGTNFTNAGVRSIDRNVLAPALAAIERDFAGQPLVQAALWKSIAHVYGRLGLYDAAVPPAKRALETRRRELGDDHPDTRASINTLCEMFGFGRQDTLADAEPYLQEVLEGRRKALEKLRRERGDDHPDTRALVDDLAMYLWLLHKYSEAEPYYREGMESNRRLLGNDHPDTLDSIAGMGTLLFYLGKPSEAEPYFREALEGERRVLGNDHPTTVFRLFELGFTLRSAGRLAEAESYFREALAGFRRVRSDDQEGTLNVIQNLANTLQDEGKFAEAEPYRREALDGQRRVYGDDHPFTLMQIERMGSLLVDQGKFVEAEPYCRRALEGCRRVLGDNEWQTLYCINNMGRLLRGLGRLEEAEALGTEAVRGWRGAGPPGDRWIGVFLTRHAQRLVSMKRFEQAEAELIEAQEILAAAAPMYPHTRNALTALAELYDAWHSAEPAKGHDAAAAEWKAKLDTLNAPAPVLPERKP